MPTTTAHGPLTPKGIERLKPRAERYHVNDSNFPGLQLRVTPNGVKSFRWAVRDSAGKQRWITIGQWALHAKPKHVTLSEAHRWLERLKEARDMGQLDQAEAELRAATAPPSPAEKSNGTTVEDVAIAFWKVLDQQRKRGSGEAKAIYEKHIKEMIGPVALQDLKRSQCSAVVERAYNNGAPIHSAKVLGLMKQMLDFAERRIADDEFMNPAARLKPKDFGIRGNRRKRWLSEAELPVFWRALDRADDETPESAADRQKMAAALRLLLLLGLRTSELRLALWEHVDLEKATFTVPVAHQKLTRAQADQAADFVVPLPPLAVEQFEALKELAKGSPWVLPSVNAEDGPYVLMVGEIRRNLGRRPWC